MRQILSALAALEPLVVLALVPLFWYPGPLIGWLWSTIPLLWGARWAARGYPSVRTPYDLPLLGFLLLLPFAFAPVVDWTLAMPKLYGVLLGIALLYALANALTNRRQVLLGRDVYVLAGGALALVGLVGTEWPASKLVPLGPFYDRLPLLITGVVYAQPRGGIHPNELGGALSLLIPLALATLLSSGEQADPHCSRQVPASPAAGPGRLLASIRWLSLLAASGLMIGVLLLTQSRSAYLGTAAGVWLVAIWWCLARFCSLRARVATGLGLGMMALLSGGLSWRLVSTWLDTQGTGLDSFPGRLELWSRGLAMLRDFPVTGIGLGQISLVLPALYPLESIAPDTYIPHAHNVFLQVALDFGIPAACAVGLIVALAGWTLGMTYRQTVDRQTQALAIGLGAGLLSFLIFGSTDAIALGARGGLGFWAVLGLSAALARLAPAEASVLSRQLLPP